jgi:hypothetical protein
MAEMTEEEQVQQVMRDLEADETTARFIVAIERGEIEGDLVELQPREPLPE